MGIAVSAPRVATASLFTWRGTKRERDHITLLTKKTFLSSHYDDLRHIPPIKKRKVSNRDSVVSQQFGPQPLEILHGLDEHWSDLSVHYWNTLPETPPGYFLQVEGDDSTYANLCFLATESKTF